MSSSKWASGQNRYDFVLRNNVLYDAALTPNLGVEIALDSTWGLGLNAGLNAWDMDKAKNKKWRHVMVSPFLRHYNVRRHRCDSLCRYNHRCDSLCRYNHRCDSLCRYNHRCDSLCRYNHRCDSLCRYNYRCDSLCRDSLAPRCFHRDSLRRRSFWGIHGVYSHYNVGGVRFPLGLYPDVHDSRRQGDLIAIGGSYGYSWRLSRQFFVEAELGLAIGYTWYKEYDCPSCGAYRGRDSKFFLLPKLGINLVWNFGRKDRTKNNQQIQTRNH